MNTHRVEFSTQVDESLLEEARAIAAREGRPLDNVVEEALRDLLEKRRNAAARPHVLAHYESSLETFGPLYERLAK
ncbi:hypothetical protein L2U69_14505 [Zavarzinia compransoris]|uniref:hypothetical protein n=1 Tax=Zavarzinia marina TaxID=2911065 RepID=UPI001F29263C|nr:hypothetical protein [Zavarzinia marina]MCF4166861.1 hypothetical protein [Zavarzinia marina]